MKKRLLLLPLLACMVLTGAFAQVVLEDFENGAALPWNADFGDSTLTVVENPEGQDTLMINPSDSVGSYTKVSGTGFSLLIAVLDEPLDLSTNNRFTIQVNSPVKTGLLLKLEGGGNAIERRQNIAVTDTWIEYSFDLSEASDVTTLDRIILFFDPGNAESSDTYLFDNLVARPANACSGVEPIPGIVDDFECQRNVTLSNPGFLNLSVIENPDKSGINTSDSVGRWDDTNGGAGGAFNALVYEFAGDIPLDARSVLNIKVWAPKTGRMVAKLERGNSQPIELDAQVEEANTWVEYSFNFSSQAGASHKALVFFFDAFEEPEPDDIYFLDDLTFTEAPTGDVLEDFEGGAQLGWEASGANTAVFGTYDGAIANPDQSGANTSETVGSYTKGTSDLGGVLAFLPGDFSLESFTQLNLQVWAPANTSEVTMNLFSPSNGLSSITQTLPANEEWVDLTFNFVDFQTVTDFERVDIIFDGNVASSGTWYFDNLSQGEGTTDPCEGIDSIPNIVDDFDCQRNIPLTVGSDRITVINNPDITGDINMDPLDKVAEYLDPNDQFSAIVWDYGAPIDLSVFNQLTIRIWSPEIVPLLFKLEGGSSNPVEIGTDVTAAEEWVDYTVDFSGSADGDFTRLVLFLNFNVVAGEEVTYYVDDVSWGRAPFTACIADFETDATSLTGWGFFQNGSVNGTELPIVDNPDVSEGNMSAKVALFREAADGGANFAGAFNSLDAPIEFPDLMNKTIRVKILSRSAAPIVLKVEGSQNGAPNSGDVFADYTTPGEWQELTFDFSGVADDGQYATLTIIPNINETPEEDQLFYFDDIVIGDASCAMSTSVFNNIDVDQLSVYPNPVQDELLIDSPEGVREFVLYNMLGQPVRRMVVEGAPQVRLSTSGLEKGMYLVSGYDTAGQLTAQARIVKN